jgi:catechol 2,3-dioxygenase-like lactoylglutathione lyase family enzyme
MTPSPNIRLVVPFFMVRDMETSLRFYRDQLGFTMTNQWEPHGKIEWCWLTRERVSIMQQEGRDREEFDNQGPKGTGVSICFQCVDALALYQEFAAKGIDIKEPFVGNNMWVLAFRDPDGYKLDFESPTDVPEETKYSEWFK